MLKLDQNWTLAFAPETGGSLSRCTYKGIPILREATGTSDPRQTSAFPMVPFIGRITDGVFTFNGAAHKLPANMLPEPHAIHGHGWQGIWELDTGLSIGLANHKDTYAQLTHSHSGQTGWPWTYAAAQVFSAQGNTLRVQLTLTNKGQSPMPAGLGWHPYFPKQGAQIHADVTHVWAGEAGHIIGNSPQPLTPETDLRKQRPVSTLSLDHCFTAGDQGLTLSWPERGLSVEMMSSDALRHLTVYTPPGEDYVCVEPVSHAPDAVNSPLGPDVTGLRILKPGQTLEAEIKLIIRQL